MLGIDILLYLASIRVRCAERELLSCLDLSLHPLFDLIKCAPVGHSLLNQPVCEQFQRIAFSLPLFFFFSRTIIGTLDVADVVSHVAVGIAEYEGRSFALPRPRHQSL